MIKNRCNQIQSLIKKFVFLTIGAALAALGLESFLVPNNIIDGGIVGISIISSYLFKIPLGYFIFTFNIPFLIFGFKKFGKSFLLSSLYSITLLSVLVNTHIFHNIITHDLLLTCVFGGMTLGIGVGLILRNNASLDGTEVLAIALAKKTAFSVGEIIMFFNIFILGSAGFVFSWDRAMYSILAYFIIFKTIDVVLEGLDESKSVNIISNCYEEISNEIIDKIGKSVTLIDATGGYSGESRKLIYCVVSRIEVAKLRSIVSEIDPQAFISIVNVHEVEGRSFKKRLK